ncbi:LysR family transcriptional regulator [Isoptericola sp. F-RaC21]|uniref:LysR family transcriptional regulator n=1 Tax=Isoptericola sp. F-RaC21 TaxID=3141452 RepID=UPI00315B919A
MDVSTAALRYFLVLAQELHFGHAADRLQITSPSLSQQISRLEKILGCRLFERSPRAVSLTTAGEELLPLAREAVEAHEAVHAWARVGRSRPAPLRIGLVASGAGELTSTILTAAVGRDPRLTVQIVRLGFFDATEAVTTGRVDVALTLGPLPPARGLRSAHLLDEPRVLVLRADHPLAGRASVHVDETNDLGLVVPSGAPDEARAWWTADPRPDGSRPRVVTVADDVEGLMELCAAGIGVNIATRSVATSFGRPGLAYVPIDDVDPAEVLVCWATRPRHPATPDFVRTALALSDRTARTDRVTGADEAERGRPPGSRRPGRSTGPRS